MWWGRVCFAAVALCLAANCALTVLQTAASMANYPGGDALARLNALNTTHAQGAWPRLAPARPRALRASGAAR